MTKQSPSAVLDAWLATVAADTEGSGGTMTVLPPADSQQPLLASFQSFRDTNSAAPLDVRGTLAEGGMGIVKLAEQKALGRTVVVKTLRSQYEAQAAEHVLREAWATGALEHPNIVPVHDIRVDAHGSPMIVLKRIEGDTWTKLMHDEELVRERFGAANLLDWNTDILRQVVQAVRFSHSRGILHRDLKPDNVMIGAFGEVYLVDWGIAMSLHDEESRLPLAKDSAEMAGTPCYMAPEMLGGEPLDARTDIYLLGAILFEILAGRPPHRTDSLETLMEDIRKSEPSLPESACPLLSDLCRRAMSRDPADRFPNADEFAAALNKNRQHRDSAKIADVAREQLGDLEAKLAEGEQSRHELYGLFGAVRGSFLEALRIWPENARARGELEHATVGLIEYELDKGNPLAAQALCRDIEIAHESLHERIAEALRKKESEQAELARFRTDRDFSVGLRTRIFVIIVLGMLWTLTPLLKELTGFAWPMASYQNMIITTLVFLAFVVSLTIWARESLGRTLVNRQFSRALIAVFPLQIALFAAADLMGLDRVLVGPLMIFVWMTGTANAVALIDYRFWPAVLGYLVAFLVAAGRIELRYFAMAGGNFGLMCTAIYVWYPRAGEYPEGLAARRRRKAES
jgi:serine/threonine-protein kinase